MSRRTLQSNYFADDKDVFDLLAAARQKLTVQKLVDFARRRGLILSTADERDRLIAQIAVLPLGWQDLNALVAATDTADRAERVASRTLTGGFSTDDVSDAVDVLRQEREDRGETYKVERYKDTLRVTVGYSELDTSKTRLVQKTLREFSLEFEIGNAGEALVRHQDQPRAQEVLGSLVDLLATKPEESIEQTKIELFGIRDPARRTAFFLRLIKGVDGFTFEDVKAVRASRFHDTSADSLPPEAADELSDQEPDDDPDREEVPTDEAQFIARVKEIALRGEGLLGTPQYEQLAEHGFFVRSIVWTSSEKKALGPRVEFEAGFDDAERGTGFTYMIRGIYSRRVDGEFKKSKATPELAERTRLLRLLETAARDALGEISPASTSNSDEGAVT